MTSFVVDDEFIEENLPFTDDDDNNKNISSSPIVIQPTIDDQQVVQVWRQLAANALGFFKGIVDKYSSNLLLSIGTNI